MEIENRETLFNTLKYPMIILSCTKTSFLFQLNNAW